MSFHITNDELQLLLLLADDRSKQQHTQHFMLAMYNAPKGLKVGPHEVAPCDMSPATPIEMPCLPGDRLLIRPVILTVSPSCMRNNVPITLLLAVCCDNNTHEA